MRKQLKLRPDGSDSGGKKCKRGYRGDCGRVWSLESGGRFCVSAFDRNLASVAMKMFSRLIYFLRNFINSLLSMRFSNLMMQQTALLFRARKVHSRKL